MTAKEAANATKQAAWGWLKRYPGAALFFAFGAVGFALGSAIDGAPDWLSKFGGASGVWSVILWLKENTAKRTGSEVTSQVFERLGEHAAKIERGDEEHAECMVLHHSHGEAIVKLRADVNELTGEAVKQGWKLGLGG